MRAGQQERPQRRGCPGGPSEQERDRLVAPHGAGLVVELGGGLGGEVGVEAGSSEVGSAEAGIAGVGSAEAGRLVVVQADEGYERGGCVAGRLSQSGAKCSKRRDC